MLSLSLIISMDDPELIVRLCFSPEVTDVCFIFLMMSNFCRNSMDCQDISFFPVFSISFHKETMASSF